MKNFVSFAACIGFGLAVGCHGSSKTESITTTPEPAVKLGTLVPGAETELAETMQRAHLAFRGDGVGYRAGHLTHDAEVIDGEISFTPRHWNGTKTIAGAPITFSTRALSRGETELDSRLYATEPLTGGLELMRVDTVERIDNRPDGVEQSWRFAQAPRGSGDLIVRVAVAGYQDVTTTKTGVHFATPGQLGARYSNAVWRDASGEAWDLPVDFDGQDLVVRVPHETLEASAFPAVLDPTISAEAAVDTLTTGNTGDSAFEVNVSYSGTQYLVVWRDNRNGVESDIYGTRVSTAGVVLDTFGLPINRGTLTQQTPVAAWAGSRWVVVFNSAGDIGAATVTGQGVVAQLGTVSADPATESLPAIAAQGSTAVAVWQSGADIRGARYNGTAFGPAFAIATTADNEADPSIAADPAGYLVTFANTTTTNLQGQLLTSAGALNGTVLSISAGTGAQFEPSSTWNGTNYVVTWTNGNDIYGARVSTAGMVLDTHLEAMVTQGGVPITTAAGVQVTSSVGCDSASCLVVWGDRRALATNGSDIFAQRVDFNMALQGTEITVSAPVRNQLGPSVAGGGTGFFGAWEDLRTGGATVAMGSRVDASGTVLDATGVLLNRGYNSERDPVFAASPSSGAVAVWSDSRALGNDIMAVRYSAAGNAIESTARTVSSSVAEQANPAASFNGTNYLVVWRDGRNTTDDIFGSRFDFSTGAALDPAGIAISTAADRQLVPDVASGGGNSLVVWQDRRNGGTTGFDIYGALVDSSGAITLNDIVISNAAGDQVRPAVTFDPANNVFVVVWSDPRNGASDIYGARVDTAGTVLDTGGAQISGAANGQFSPDVAVSGSQLLVVWDDRRNETFGDVYGARITAAGSISVLDATGIAIASTAGSSQASPTVVGTTGGRWAVVWTDGRNSATTLNDLYGIDVQTNGTLAPEFLISGGPEDEHDAAFQNDPNTALKVSVVYQKLRTDINTQRVYRRTLTYQGDNGTTCSMASQCASGFCVDGFCCDQACGGTQNAFPRDCQACSVARGAAVNGTCAIVTAGTVCRSYNGGGADAFCDVKELCDGVSTTCPDDLGRNQGLACTGICGSGTCPSNAAAGAPHLCVCP